MFTQCCKSYCVVLNEAKAVKAAQFAEISVNFDYLNSKWMRRGNIWPQNGNKMQICNPSIAACLIPGHL